MILFSVTPIGCLLAMLVGLLITWYLFPTRFINAQIADFSDDEAQEIVIMAAADFAEHGDEERARALLAELEVPNQAQYVSLVAERMIRTNRGAVDQDIDNVVRLADALGVSTVSMIAYVSSPTSVPTTTPVPTDTPTITPTPTNTLVVQAVAEPEQAVEVEEAAVEEVPLAELFPTDGSVPDGSVPDGSVPDGSVSDGSVSDAPVSEAPPPTAVPVPTDTPEPTATPVPEFDYIITKERMLTKEENGGCVGMHNIFVDVVDANGAPIKDVELGDVWGNPGPSTGHKGDDQPGRAVYDLYKNGFKIFVKNDPTAGRPITSQVTKLLSSNDWEIGIPQLIESGYCPDEATCRVLWNSGVFGEGNNSLCWGHYSWEVTFQRTW